MRYWIYSRINETDFDSHWDWLITGIKWWIMIKNKYCLSHSSVGSLLTIAYYQHTTHTLIICDVNPSVFTTGSSHIGQLKRLGLCWSFDISTHIDQCSSQPLCTDFETNNLCVCRGNASISQLPDMSDPLGLWRVSAVTLWQAESECEALWVSRLKTFSDMADLLDATLRDAK